MKIYLASSVQLSHVPAEHRSSSNGGCQFFILVRTTSKKEIVRILGTSMYTLRYFGCHEAGEHIGFGENKLRVADIVKKNNTVYYQAGHTRNGYNPQWFEYVK